MSDNFALRAMAGTAAGLVATLAMTVFMSRAHSRLRSEDRYPLPPRIITDHLLDRRLTKLDRRPFGAFSVFLAHFMFGAAAGALYSGAFRSPPPPLSGVGYALLVWGASYLGWVPATGAMLPATQHPAGRNALMIAAHLVWGGVLEAAYRGMMSSDREQAVRKLDARL